MEIEIQSKINNPLLNRTEIHFIVHHDAEKTPKRELIRTELAAQLKVKKENVIVNFMKSNFGLHETVGYAKIYKKVEEAQNGEQNHILKRNQGAPKEKKEKEGKPVKETEETTPEEKPVEQQEQTEPTDKEPEQPEKQTDEKTEEQPAEPPQEEQPSKEKKE